MKTKLFLLFLFTGAALAASCGEPKEEICDWVAGAAEADKFCEKNYPCKDPNEKAQCFSHQTNSKCQTFCDYCDCPSEMAGGGIRPTGGIPLQQIDLNQWL